MDYKVTVTSDTGGSLGSLEISSDVDFICGLEFIEGNGTPKSMAGAALEFRLLTSAGNLITTIPIDGYSTLIIPKTISSAWAEGTYKGELWDVRVDAARSEGYFDVVVGQRTGIGRSHFSQGLSITDLTPSYLKQHYLFGIKLLDDNGNEYPDDFWYQKIGFAAGEVERVCNIRVLPTPIKDETHDYYVEEYSKFAFLKLDHQPILSVDRIRMVYPTMVEGVTFPKEWAKIDRNAGQLQLIPTAGTLSQVILGIGGSFLPMMTSGLSYLPQLFHIDYTAGFDYGKCPRNVFDAVAKKACIDILTVVADVIYPPGMTSKSVNIDGLGESFSIMNNGNRAPVFTGRISQYMEELYGDGRTNRGVLAEIRDQYVGIKMAGAR